MKRRTAFLPYAMWGCAVLYYLFQYVIRVSPGILMDDIMQAFHLNAQGFATLSALAMYAYAFMQIPAGIAADTFGTRRIILFSIILCIFGIALFASAPSLWVASLGRICIGVGSAAAFLSVNKIGTAWFPPSRTALVFGLTMTAGTIGAINGAAPLSVLISHLGWRESLFIVSGVGLLIFFVNFFFLKPHPQASQKGGVENVPSQKITLEAIGTHLRAVITNRQIVLLALVSAGLYLPLGVLADLWGVSYLMQSHGIEKIYAAQATSLIYVGLCVGSLVLSWLSDRLGKRQRLIVSMAFSVSLWMILFLYIPHLPMGIICVLLFLIGFSASATILCFTLGVESAGIEVRGTVIGFINSVTTIGGAFTQQQVGKILDYVWCGQCTADGLRFYTVSEYQKALSMMIAVAIITTFLSLFLKEKDR